MAMFLLYLLLLIFSLLLPITNAGRPIIRGGSSSTDQSLQTVSAATILQQEKKQETTTRRRAAEVVRDFHEDCLLYKTSPKAREVLDLVRTRRDEYLQDLTTEEKTPHPKKLLHFLAPKIPAIKRSPDIALQIQSTKDDATIAACVIATVAYACESYDRRQVDSTAASDILKDRRFEQLIECILYSGINRKRRMKEYAKLEDESEEATEIEEKLDDLETDEGLSIRDACRAAWGIAVIASHDLESIGGAKVSDILISLSLRIRELILAKLQTIRKDDLSRGDASVEEELDSLSLELARDAATSIWTFACVRACTGIRATHLFEVAFSILCLDPVEIRRKAQEDFAEGQAEVGSNDVVDKLARSEDSGHEGKDGSSLLFKDKEGQSKDAFIDWLSTTEIIDTVWGLAVHGHKDRSKSKHETALSENVGAFCEMAFDRISMRLSDEVGKQQFLSASLLEDDPSIGLTDAASILSAEVNTEAGQEIPDGILENADQVDELQEPIDPESNPLFDSKSVEANHLLDDLNVESVKRLSFDLEASDLGTIVWAVTELQDSLRCRIVDLSTSIFVQLGATFVRSLAPSDLPNLLWGISKCPKDAVTHATSLIRLLSGRMLNDPACGLESLQAPEISRVLWSLTTFNAQTPCLHDELPRLAGFALKKATANTEVFGTEDLARILWAYFEAHDSEKVLKSPNAIVRVGELLSIIESSLKNWEIGRGASNVLGEVQKESVRFATFFGRTRFHAPILQQRLEEYVDDPDDYPIPINMEKRLPRLKDLPIDPSTLCKLTHALLRTSKRKAFEPVPTFLKISLRLLTSHNGRLLRECTIGDIGRVCEALTFPSDQSRELSGLFIRRVLRFLNENVDWHSQSDFLDNARLLYSLGRLGVKYSPQSDSRIAHRRLEFTSSIPSISSSDLEHLSTQELVRFFGGLIDFEVQAYHPELISDILSVVLKREDLYAESSVIIEVLESILELKHTDSIQSIDLLEESSSNSTQSNATVADLETTANSTLNFDFETITKGVIAQMSRDLASKLPYLRVQELTKILSVLVQSYIRVDDFIKLFDREIQRRKESLRDIMNSEESMSFLFARAMADASETMSMLKGDEKEGHHPLSIIRHGIQGLFGQQGEQSDKESDRNEKEEESKPDQDIQVRIETAMESVIAAMSLVNRTEIACAIATEDIFVQEQERMLVELGRCTELVAQYRRYDFDTGTAPSRFNTVRRRAMTKRMLTRLLP